MNDIFQSPLAERWASREMLEIWSADRKFRLWREIWIALAEAEKECGLPITDEQIAEMRANVARIDYERAAQKEAELRHDVMAHIHVYGEQCPKAKPIIHLGATSCDITDNADLICIRDSMKLLLARAVNVIETLSRFALQYKDLPTLGRTHFQPAQPTTVGKRACLWLQDFLCDLAELERRIGELRFRGIKGTTGTQASFLELLGDGDKVRMLEKLVAEKMGFSEVWPVTGQTYTRKADWLALSTLSGIGQSAHKMATDIRLLAGLKEIEEPFGKKQVGSSAMPYKRNPMRCERMCALGRFLIANADNAAHTHAAQWLERTLDDSANRRLSLAEGFLAADAVLMLAENVTDGLVVYPEVIRADLEAELPFMATENILMAAVNAGGDRQELHQRIRDHAVEAGRQVKELGRKNNMLELIAADPAFAAVKEQLAGLMDPKAFIGLASEQVERFCAEHVRPAIERNGKLLRCRELIGKGEDLRV
ncbi:MAG TPA: adenylosuccinate lyase [Candidatus Brocadiia bacterium]|nr:adenylosuccinate lyase [Candidatus Brocadiia bacterium]